MYRQISHTSLAAALALLAFFSLTSASFAFNIAPVFREHAFLKGHVVEIQSNWQMQQQMQQQQMWQRQQQQQQQQQQQMMEQQRRQQQMMEQQRQQQMMEQQRRQQQEMVRQQQLRDQQRQQEQQRQMQQRQDVQRQQQQRQMDTTRQQQQRQMMEQQQRRLADQQRRLAEQQRARMSGNSWQRYGSRNSVLMRPDRTYGTTAIRRDPRIVPRANSITERRNETARLTAQRVAANRIPTLGEMRRAFRGKILNNGMAVVTIRGKTWYVPASRLGIRPSLKSGTAANDSNPHAATSLARKGKPANSDPVADAAPRRKDGKTGGRARDGIIVTVRVGGITDQRPNFGATSPTWASKPYDPPPLNRPLRPGEKDPRKFNQLEPNTFLKVGPNGIMAGTELPNGLGKAGVIGNPKGLKNNWSEFDEADAKLDKAIAEGSRQVANDNLVSKTHPQDPESRPMRMQRVYEQLPDSLKKEMSLQQAEKMLNVIKGFREIRFSDEYTNSHLELFKDGLTKFVSSRPDGNIGGPLGHFAMPKATADRLMEIAKGDVAKLEGLLGLTKGELGEKPIRLDIDNPTGMRLPSGNEPGANRNMFPGGYVINEWPDGEVVLVPEVVIDPVKAGAYKCTNFHNGESCD